MKKGKILFLILVLAAAGYAAYYFLRPAKEHYVYRTQAVTTGSITTTISATGKLSAVEMVEVGTQVSGTIDEIYVDYNTPVKKGQLLAVLDPDVLTSQVAAAKASLAVSQAGVASASASVVEAERNHNRNKELWERKLIARSEVESTETSLALARASLAEARARVAQSQESLKQSETNLNYARITSPIDGVIVDKAVEVGQTVAASFSTPTLFSIAKDLTQMQIEANIDEADIGNIKAGQKAMCTFDAWPDERFEATVSQIRLSPETISNVVTYIVILKIDNSEKRLLPGMTANLNVITEQRENVVRIPAAALRFSPPADVLAAMEPESAPQNNDNGGSSGLMAMPRRMSSSQNGSVGQTVWVVENGELKRKIELHETGVSDRTWVEVKGDALKDLEDGTQLAVAFTKEAAGSAVAGTGQ